MGDDFNEVYRRLPGVGEVLDRPGIAALASRYGQDRMAGAVRACLSGLRERVRAGTVTATELEGAVKALDAMVEQEVALQCRPRLRRVVNATGVLLQTNLGRAPLSEEAIERVCKVARGYCNLEFDLVAGERGKRDVLLEELILRVAGGDLGAYGTVVVNNCAAATYLALNSIAEAGEVIVSRGELVEIGGGFRIPEVLEKSGATLREVGTTNRTRIGDYAAAIGPATRMILRVHRSNFEIRGFTEQPSLGELVALGRRAGVPVFDDQGTGCVLDLTEVGLPAESSWTGSVRSGVSLVACSGDKLLGGPQCGVLVGERHLVERLRANPLYRALRADKLTYAALEATLTAYVSGREGTLPMIAMLRQPAEAVRRRCEQWVQVLQSERCRAEVVPVRSVIGGGTTPGATLASFAVALRVAGVSEGELCGRFRGLDPAVVSRVSEGRVLLDLRTVQPAEDEEVVGLLRELLLTL